MGLAYKFDWSVLWREPYGEWMLQGIWLTLQMGFLAWIIALFLGIFVGTMRAAPWKLLRLVSTIYVEIFRNVPFLVQLFFWFYAGPMIFGKTLQFKINAISGLNYYVAVVGLGLYTASRVAEHVRAGFASIGQGQYQAALSTGMSQWQMYWHIMIPHALRLILPPLTTEFLTIFKNSSVAMTIGVAETTFMSYKIDSDTFHGLEATTGAMFVYLVLGMAVVKTMSYIETKFRIHGLVGR
jgi:glutamate/aspartate transport system permease protein